MEGGDDEVDAWLADDTVDLGVVLNPSPGRDALMLGTAVLLELIRTRLQAARRQR